MNDKNYYAQVKELLRIEADAIKRTAARIDSESVECAVELLMKCRGKVVVVGVGKSGNIAQKVAATMTSTGTPALFLHGSDAMHGGMGAISEGDVVVALSNSGETDEIVGMLPFLNSRGFPLLAIVGNLNSTLARRADIVLDASVDQEACPLNLSPTTSTTVALAIGDALAMTLMQSKGLTEDDFAMNHPGGRLGKRLTLRVADLMHEGTENPTVRPEAAWLEVVAAISKGGLGAVNVVDESNRLVGIITDGDLRRTIQKIDHAELKHLTSERLMTSEPAVASPEMLAYDALQLMEDRPSQISVLPVVNGQGLCVGLIRLHDIVRSGI